MSPGANFVNNSISEKHFHEFTHILYDIRTLLGNKSNINYLEIGSYIGSSASLVLRHPFLTKVYCIDPLNLNKNHYNNSKKRNDELISTEITFNI